ncbi:hypothetical protein Tco_0194904 [Tanacetum coccineum]
MLGLRLVLLCSKEEVMYHGQAYFGDTLTERGRQESFLNIRLMKYEKLVIASRSKRAANTHDPFALVVNTYASSSSSQSPTAYYVTHPPFMVDYDDDYQGDEVCDDQEDSLTTATMLLSSAITQRSTPINNRLRTSSNTRNQSVVQADRVNIQSRNVGNGGRFSRMSSNTQGEFVESHYARECPKPRVRDSKYFMEQMLLAKKGEAGVILSNEHNDFLVDVAQMEELEE